ncbi:MAG TPA: class I SAM-dependent methyltransferase [Syntrophorhabdaceae bacterium]|nr:class I SAM-dependent methyltransferase [Syntrophorhabdaceae bacterium]HQM80962.1 class I SAM-dependent methyltransferase [Syntrophorhabdaceae bacterium]
MKRSSRLKGTFDRFVDPGRKIRDSKTFRNIEAGVSAVIGLTGSSPPWKRNEREYWRSRDKGEKHGPENYLQEDNSTYVVFEGGLLKALKENASFLEIGCNAGRNLNYLLKQGYTDLAGIEINDASVNVVLKEHFPDLYEKGTFFVGNALDEIKKIPNERYDVVFSIGVFEHIPYEDKALFNEVARVSKRYIAIITSVRSRLFNYNYEKIFRNLGFTNIEYRLFYGENHNFSVPVEPYDAKKHTFDSKFLRIFIKNTKKG